ncbi:PKD domain-containing protein [Neolewinella aurantiaca]|nr:PKD domain-containing protein [Neolewinella aurantiaca]
MTYDGFDFADRPSTYYAEGDSVELCFSLDNQFQTPDAEWVHAVLIASVGPGFKFGSVVPSGPPPTACRPAGNWAFYDTWSRCMTNCPTTSTFYNGYAFDSSEGTGESCGDPGVLDGDPGNNYGDGPGNCGLVFCWKVEVVDAGGVPAADAYSVQVRVLADGVSGGYSGGQGGFCRSPCTDLPDICFPEIGEVDTRVLNEPCPGENFNLEAFFPGGGNFNGLDVIWQDAVSGSVVAMGQFASLPEGNYTVSVSRPGCASQAVDVVLDLTIPVLEYMGPPDGEFFCHGEPIDMSITVTNATVNSIIWTLDGTPVSNGNSYSIAEATAADGGEYSINVNYGDGCDTAFVLDLFVGDNVLLDITPYDTAYCEFDIITFTAAQTNGMPIPNDWTMTWDGGVGSGPTYTFSAFGNGPQIAVLEVIDGDGCVFQFDHPYTVNALPEVSIDPVEQSICSGQTATVVATPISGTPPFSYVWGPENIVTGDTYTVEPPYTLQMVDFDVSITDANGCINYSELGSVFLSAPPVRPSLSCIPVCVSEIRFNWTQSGASFFQLYARINFGPEMLIEDNYTDLEYLFTGLNPGDMVELRVVPFAGDAVNNCEGPDRSRSCDTPLFSTPGFVVDFPDPVCTEDGGSSIELGISAGEEGTFVMNSVSLGLTDSLADADGSTTILIPGLPAGTNSQVHTVDIAYEGVGGRCPSDTTIQITAVRAPEAEFSLDAISVCGNSADFTATLTTPATVTDVYDLQLENPAVGSVASGGLGTWDITIDSVGTHTLVLTTQNALDAACVDTFRAQVTLVAPLPAPVIQCGSVGLDFVTFIWNDTGHDSYTVNEIDIPAGGVVTRNGNSVSVTNLSVDDVVMISVTGVSAGCPDVVSEIASCVAESCPDITLSIDDPGTFCESVDQDIDFTVTAQGSDGSGILSWQIDGAPFSGTFNPSVLGAGSYTIDALLDEGCDFRASIQLVINPVPSSAFDLPDGPICINTEVLGAVAGAAQAGFTYEFSAPGAVTSPGADDASMNFSWTTPGRKYVSLTVTSDEGCIGETFTDSIDVATPLITPVVQCDTVDMEFVVFSWPNQMDADSFAISIDGGPVFFQDSTTLYVGGLGVGQTVGISVQAIGEGPCALPAAGTGSCTTVSCPSLTITPPADTTFCSMDGPLQYPLTAIITGDNGAGMVTFSGGPGVIQVGNDYFFDIDSAGVGEHLITVDFEEGMCMGSETFTYTVTQTPTSDFTVNGSTSGVIDVCVGESFSVEYTGNMTAQDSATFCWTYTPDDQLPTPIDTFGFESHNCMYQMAGTYRICLEVKLDSCTSEMTCFDIVCSAPPEAPVVDCSPVDLNSILFTWNAVANASGYLLTFDDGSTTTTTDLEYTATGLQPGESFGLEVVAISSNQCGDSPSSGRMECSSEPCPSLTADLSSVPEQICILDGDETIALTDIVVTGGLGTGNFTFNGAGVVNDTFYAATVPYNEAGTTYTISMMYGEAGPCPLDTTFDITVFRRPMAFFTDPGAQCLGDTTLVRVGSTNFVANNDVRTNFADGTIIPDGDPDDTEYLIVFPTAGTRTITATVISNISGCPSEEVTLDIEVIAPLPAPALVCGTATLETVEVTWADIPGATGYVVTTSNEQSETLPAGSTSYTAVNLLPSTDVTFTVNALGDAPCGDGPVQTLICRTMDCPGGVVQSDTPAGSQCLDGTESAILLEASLTSGDPFNGTVAWSGTGVVDNGDGTFSFDPTGLAAGDYTATVNYDGPANCDSEASVVLTLFDVPVIGFNAMPAQLCEGEEFNIFFTGTAETGDEFVWDFDGAVVNDLNDESYLVRWDTPGLHMVSLTVNGNCSASADFEIDITPTLEAPLVNCTRQDLDGVLFTWADVPAASEGYRVSVNGGPYGSVQDSTSFYVGDLDFGENVTINVISVRSGTNCDQSAPSTAVDCAARECPDVTFAPAASQTVFCDDETEPVILSANLAGDDGTGDLEWTGNGVVNNNGEFSFDPVMAGVGTHTLTVTYVQEALCSYSETMEMTVNATPAVAITQGANITCTGTMVTFSLDGTRDPETEYSFEFGNATVSDLGNENYEVSYSAGGTYTVTLTAERNGCMNTATTTIAVEEEVSAGTPVSGALDICAGTSELIDLSSRVVNATEGGTWSTTSGGVPNGNLNATTGSLNPGGLAAGSYTFAYTVDGGSCPEDVAEVTVNLLAAPIADAGPGQRLTCNMGMVSLDGSNSESGDGYTYLWTSEDPNVIITDADQQMIDVGQPGVYQLRVTNAIGCSAVSEVTVTAETEAPVMELEVSNITCFASDNGAISVTNVSGGRPPYTYRLNGEDRGQSTLFANLEPGSHDVQITDANGCFSNVILDLTQPDELTVRLQFPGDSTSTTAGTEIFITASVNGGNSLDTLIWQPDSVTVGDGQNGIRFIANETQMISVTVVDELGCTATDQMMLLVRRDRPVYFPTAFSPNGDNINDIFFIGGDLDQIDYISNFLIFDRWGEAVYTGPQNRTDGMGGTVGEGFLPNDPAFGWDGTLNGKTMNPQVLVYTATVHFSDGEVIVYKGDFVLMR